MASHLNLCLENNLCLKSRNILIKIEIKLIEDKMDLIMSLLIPTIKKLRKYKSYI